MGKQHHNENQSTPLRAMTSYFDNIPNEVLEHIVSLVPWYENVKFTEEGKEHVLCQVVVLLQVSRRFRRATQHPPIWHEFLFEFEGLVPDAFIDDDDHPLPANAVHRVNGLCHALFADSYFVSCLQSKCDWSFSTLESLLVVQLRVPSFSKSARTVLLSLKGTDVAIHRLSTCQNLTGLHIHGGNDASLDLSSIARYAPQLKALFIDCPRMVFGSLSEIKGLQELALQCLGGELNFGDLNEDDILVPIASQNTFNSIDPRGRRGLLLNRPVPGSQAPQNRPSSGWRRTCCNPGEFRREARIIEYPIYFSVSR